MQLMAGQQNLLELLVSVMSPHTVRPQRDVGLALGTPDSVSCAKSLSQRRVPKGLAGLPSPYWKMGLRWPTLCLT